MVNMRIEKALLDTEMTVVRNEFERGENSVTNVLEERVLSSAYIWHNYGKSTIGSRVDIERVPIDRLAAFYKKYYQPDNAVVVISGQVDQVPTLSEWGLILLGLLLAASGVALLRRRSAVAFVMALVLLGAAGVVWAAVLGIMVQSLVDAEFDTDEAVDTLATMSLTANYSQEY